MSQGPDYDDDARLVARERRGDNAEPLSVGEISRLLKSTVEDRFGHVRLRGELSGVKRAASGHLYASMKDDKAVIDAVMWRGNAGRLAFAPEDGLEVIATGKVTTYPGRSKYQIVVDSMEIAGEGALLALLEKLKVRLDAEGLFAAERKRPLPFLPHVIGVVTSPTGAVIRDILHRLSDRFPTHVVVWPVMVQGKGAAEQVAAAVRGFSAMGEGGAVPRPDVVIVARGGGSIEDLWSFNEEIVVRAIAECTIPTISAVGHETDTTLADLAADRRAPTPSAAAEMVVPVRGELVAGLLELAARKRRGVMRPLDTARERLTGWSERLPDPHQIVAERGQRLDDLGERLRRGLATRAAQAEGRLNGVGPRLRPGLIRDRAIRDRQRLNDFSQRAARGLSARADRAASRLAQAASGVRAPVLMRRVEGERQRLARVPSSRDVLNRRMERLTTTLAASGRLLDQLNPFAPLERGYAVVTAGDTPVTSRAQAAKEPAMTLMFRDGMIDVFSAPPRRKSPPRRPEPEQGSLL